MEENLVMKCFSLIHIGHD